MLTFLSILATGCGTYFSRSVFILALAKRRVPPRVVAAMEFVVPAVFGALIATLMVSAEGEIAIGIPEAAGLATATAVAAISRSHIYTLVGGMAVFWLCRLL